MKDVQDDLDSIVIKIPKSAWDKTGGDSSASMRNPVHKSEILQRTGLSVVVGKKNSDYGITDVQTLATPSNEQRMKVLGLINNSAIYGKLPHILDFIFDLGRSTDAELRYFAALSVVQLATVIPFTELKDGVIARWAKYGSETVNRIAAISLAGIARDQHVGRNVLTLLKHWIDLHNRHLAGTALSAYSEIALLYPTEALDAARKVVVNEYSLLFVPRVMTLISRLYREEPVLVTDTLHDWFFQTQSVDLKVFAGLTFLAIADILDFGKQEGIGTHTLALTFELWEGPRLPQRSRIQELTGDAVYEWANTTLSLEEQNPVRSLCIAWFHRLYAKCAATRQNRLEYYLNRWQLREKQRVTKLGRSPHSDLNQATARNFQLLSPDTMP